MKGDKDIFKDVLNQVLKLGIKDLIYDKNIQLSNATEYEFELVKCKAILNDDDKEVDVYLKMIKNNKIKESIFCYWCTIYEEELLKTKEMEYIINKVLISELEKTKYKKRIFLTIENNETKILETGSEINFIEIINYIKEMQNNENEYYKLEQYFGEDCSDILLVGIKNKKN